MAWSVEFLEEAVNDLGKLDMPVRKRALKAIRKVAQNPLPQSEGGYGKPLGRHAAIDLVGLLKVKLRADGIRIVYRIERVGEEMLVVVVGVRADAEVYREAARRRQKHGL
ncbi:MAG: type II toxin-antitoxin system RelE/ParE family toxin [Atopobiaceae bacterium]|nr:type II toxin-antitoxin system RelE/ParE family toxin [Atopobiaceae bacterium]